MGVSRLGKMVLTPVILGLLASGCAGSRPSAFVAGTSFRQSTLALSGEEYVFASTGASQPPTSTLVETANCISEATHGLPNTHIWTGTQFVIDFSPPGKPLESSAMSEAASLALLSVKLSGAYQENDYRRNPHTDLGGSLAVQFIGTWLVPSVTLDEVGDFLAHKLDGQQVRAFFVQQITFDNGVVTRIAVFPTSSAPVSVYTQLGKSLPKWLLHEGWSTQSQTGPEGLAPFDVDACPSGNST